MKASADGILGGKSVGQLLAEGFEELAAEMTADKNRIHQKFTCRKLVLNLTPVAYDPGLVKKTRKILNTSQTVFAQFLGVSPQTVRAWEQGVNTPRDSARRLMDEIRHDPGYWKARILELAQGKKALKLTVHKGRKAGA